MKNKPLPTLTFTHQFSNGLFVTLTIERAEFTPPVMRADHKGFQTPDIEREYLEWSRIVSEKLAEEHLLTDGEIIALALRSAGIA